MSAQNNVNALPRQANFNAPAPVPLSRQYTFKPGHPDFPVNLPAQPPQLEPLGLFEQQPANESKIPERKNS